MLKLLLKTEAKNDLVQIFEYTLYNRGLEQAEKYQDELIQGKQLLTEQENLGKMYPFTDSNYRKFHANRHLNFYRVDREKCIIVRILHEEMEIKNHLK